MNKINFVDIENSYIYSHPKLKNCVRLGIKSILLDVKENNYYYLTKECLAELIGIKPFDHPLKLEVCFVGDSNKNRLRIRDIPVFKFDEFGPLYYETTKNADYKIHKKRNVNIKILTYSVLIKN